MPVYDVALSVLGGLVLLAVLTDLFLALLYPAGRGVISDPVMAAVWRLTRRAGRRTRAISGALAVVAAILTWVALAVLGGALLVGPHLPEAFSYGTGLDPARGPWLDAFYVSAVTLTTLGFGDVVPTEGWLRALVPLLALTGFALLTAAVTWVMQLYPALTRRRRLALQLSAYEVVGTADRLGSLGPTTAARLLEDVASGLGGVRMDLTQYAETFYFHEADDDASLPTQTKVAARLVDAARASEAPDVRHAGEVLQHALAGVAHVLDADFLHTGGSTADTLRAWAEQHA